MCLDSFAQNKASERRLSKQINVWLIYSATVEKTKWQINTEEEEEEEKAKKQQES